MEESQEQSPRGKKRKDRKSLRSIAAENVSKSLRLLDEEERDPSRQQQRTTGDSPGGLDLALQEEE